MDGFVVVLLVVVGVGNDVVDAFVVVFVVLIVLTEDEVDVFIVLGVGCGGFVVTAKLVKIKIKLRNILGKKSFMKTIFLCETLSGHLLGKSC